MNVDTPARAVADRVPGAEDAARAAHEELIIKEARRRHRRRLLTIAGIAVVGIAASLLAVVGLTGNGPSPRTPNHRPPVVRQPAPPGQAVATTCLPSDLGVSILNLGPATGSSYLAVAFRNTGTSTCTLAGYPQLEMLGASGQPIPTTVTNATLGELAPPVGPNRPLHGAPPATLRPGQEASFMIAASDGNTAPTPQPNCPATASFHISPPGAQPGSAPIVATVPPFAGNPQHPWIAYPRSHDNACGDISVSVVAAGAPN